MKTVSVLKVPNGKMLKLHIEAEASITAIQIHGDFFLHPEEGIEMLESALQGLPVSQDPLLYSTALQQAISKHSLQLLGVSPENIASALVQGLKNMQEARQ